MDRDAEPTTPAPDEFDEDLRQLKLQMEVCLAEYTKAYLETLAEKAAAPESMKSFHDHLCQKRAESRYQCDTIHRMLIEGIEFYAVRPPKYRKLAHDIVRKLGASLGLRNGCDDTDFVAAGKKMRQTAEEDLETALAERKTRQVKRQAAQGQSNAVRAMTDVKEANNEVTDGQDVLMEMLAAAQSKAENKESKNPDDRIV